jgi:CRISPR-associated protein Cmr4
MNYQFALLFYQPITPLHVGCGQDVGVVDLPVIRERTTGYPFVPGSGIRGSVRALFEERDRVGATDEATRLFGPSAERSEADEVRYAGCVAIHDARLLLYPVRSDQQVFLWITCPAALARFHRDVGAFLSAEESRRWEIDAGGGPGDEGVVASRDLRSPLYLEELSFRLEEAAEAGAAWSRLSRWAGEVGQAVGAPELAGRVVLVSDSTFHYFVQHATVLLQHNRLTSAKTVEDGGLFSVEAVPPEAVFYGFWGATRERRPAAEGETSRTPAEVLASLRTGLKEVASTGYLHLGGDESTGLGVTRLAWTGGAA